MDRTRMHRGFGLRVEQLENEDGKYLVHGGTEPHWVDMNAFGPNGRYFTCDCGDFAWRHGTLKHGVVACKHISAVLLTTNDAAAWKLLGDEG